MIRTKRDQGFAVILALIVTTLLGALGVTLMLVSDTERRFSSNDRNDHATRYAAGAALERALADLGVMDWGPILAGGQRSAFVDGTRRPMLSSGQPLDLDVLTGELQAASHRGASFGANTPVWRLFAWGRLATLDPHGPLTSGHYLVMWVADDVSETDDNPFADSNGILTVHAEAFGVGQCRRSVEAVVERTSGRLRAIAWREL